MDVVKISYKLFRFPMADWRFRWDRGTFTQVGVFFPGELGEVFVYNCCCLHGSGHRRRYKLSIFNVRLF